MNQAEQVWRSKTDDELSGAATHLEEFTEEGERIIRAELKLRSLPEPPPTVRQVEAPAAARSGTKKAAPDTVLSHWSTLIENLSASPLQFYQSVEAALERRQIPATTNARVDYRESGALSAKREYLHVTREDLVVDICGAPFGTGFFVSWWMAEAKVSLHPLVKILAMLGMLGLVGASVNQFGVFGGILAVVAAIPVVLWIAHSLLGDSELSDQWIVALPLVGWLYAWFFKSETYYRIDTREMFQKAVHNAVLEVIDEMTTAKGLRALGESERKPIMREFYQRKAA